MSGGTVLIPRGAPVSLVAAKVELGGSMKGSDLIQLKAAPATVSGRPTAILTHIVEQNPAGEGMKSTRRTLRFAELCAVIGALPGAAGGAVLLAGKPHLKIPAESVLPFQSLADVKLQ